MIRRRQINARRRAPRLRSLLTRAGERIRDVAMTVEERVGWPLADRARAAFEVAGWPFERAKWTTERRVVWPLGERAARHGVSGSSLAVGAALLATCAVAAGAIVAGGGGGEASTVAEAPERASAEPAKSAPATAPEPAPVLHGAAPDFTPEGGDAAAKVANRDTVIASKPDAGKASSASSADATATPSSAGRKVEDPGPAAIDVARRFSGAFVLYETGRDDAKVRAAFDATASPRLKQALLRRPPRLPANVKVPKAKVLNVVPGPRHGDTFTLSASLLRVGVTSELRIDVQRDDESGEWQVTDVLG
jgi:hypothetical protein